MPKLPKVSKSVPLTGTKKAAPVVQSASCLCGCLEPVGPRSTFRQGHDQRFIGELARDVVDGTLTNGMVERLQLPTEVDGHDIEDRIRLVDTQVSKFSSPALAAKFEKAARRRWEKITKDSASRPEKAIELSIPSATELKAREDVLDDYDDLGIEPEDVVPGAPVRVKVGRWEYDATIHGMSQAGKVTAVRYYDSNDKEKVKTEGQFTIVPD